MLLETISGLFKKAGVEPREVDKAAIYAPNARRAGELARSVGLDLAQLQDPMLDTVGCTGTVYAPMLFVAALEEATSGSKVLMASYGNGGDAMLFTVKEGVERLKALGGGSRAT